MTEIFLNLNSLCFYVLHYGCTSTSVHTSLFMGFMAIDIKLFSQKLLLLQLSHHPAICIEELFTPAKFGITVNVSTGNVRNRSWRLYLLSQQTCLLIVL